MLIRFFYNNLNPKINNNPKILIIGGKQIYDLLLPKCSKIWLSVISGNYDCDLKLELNFEKYGILQYPTETFMLYCLTLL